MDFDEERDFADQGPLTDIDMEEDSQILATLLKHLPSCINAAIVGPEVLFASSLFGSSFGIV